VADEIVNVRGCARCGGTHDGLAFKSLDAPIVESDGTILTHSAPCPKTGRAILLGTAPVGKANSIPAAVNYRPASAPGESCATCAYFDVETARCAMFDVTVSPKYVCDKWSDVVKRIVRGVAQATEFKLAKLRKAARCG